MAINQNHTFEEIDGVKCAIVEKNVSGQRADFLKNILHYNGYTVIVATSPPAKPAAGKVIPTGAPVIENVEAPALVTPETFTVGVTDVTFNAINAIFGRLLRTPDGHVVTLSYWQQKESVSQDEIPYFERSR